MRFLLVCEGNSDVPLGFHIQRLIGNFGIHQSDFNVSTHGTLLVEKLRNGLRFTEHYDLVLVHRDADGAGAASRYQEISAAIRDAEYSGPWAGIVPVRMTEAWLLLDEAAIRSAVGNPNGRTPLGLPTPAATERIADPKSTLRSAMLDAGDVQGRRRRTMERQLTAVRDRLLENLPVGGALERLDSWVRFRDDTIAALREVGG